MTERGILFQGPMVRALMRTVDPKTETRRGVKLPHKNPLGAWEVLPWGGPKGGQTIDGKTIPFQNVIGHSRTGDVIACPYGQPGDRLWVRETFLAWGRWETRFSEKKGRDEWHFIDMTLEAGKAYHYDADGINMIRGTHKHRAGVTQQWWKRPAIHMPRVASRLTLEITRVRVEQLQAITPAAAIAEGIEKAHVDLLQRQRWRMYDHLDGTPGEEIVRYCGPTHTLSPVESYRTLWLSINGPGSWDTNPWVWVVGFKRL